MDLPLYRSAALWQRAHRDAQPVPCWGELPILMRNPRGWRVAMDAIKILHSGKMIELFLEFPLELAPIDVHFVCQADEF